MNSHSTAWWLRLAGCALLAGCGPSVAGSGAPVPAGGAECAAGAVGEGYPAALLRIGCDGGVVGGRADWSREGGVVTLEFPGAGAGPMGVELVSAWPPLGEPPWLGHRIENITVLSGGRVQVRFGEAAEGHRTSRSACLPTPGCRGWRWRWRGAVCTTCATPLTPGRAC